ncbi:DUF5671 domain-containing protein [Actibacterium sp. MT2.3-13A]|uniref:DUF5671 domain-containing protein n=1 Tax=Actibacterium sp. MT2.3-13A TaxID=2828332 RepID=UPI001BACB346|nr:DUF5671 domain-containing protein [Actibacterium sp. MT2.3-13A]
MRPADQLAHFVAEALKAGRTRAEISAALHEAGWTGTEVAGALDAWAESAFSPPVPRPRPYVSAREAFLYALMFLALAMTAWNITTLGFELIELWLPDVTDRFSRYNAQSVRWSISVLVVFFPLFLVMNARAQRAAHADPGQRRSAVRKWFGYITLFLAAIALLGDLIAVIYALLSGDLTARFLAKAALVALTAGLIFLYFRGEMGEARDAH